MPSYLYVSDEKEGAPWVSPRLPPATEPLFTQRQLHGLLSDLGLGSWGAPPVSHHTVQLTRECEPKERGSESGLRELRHNLAPHSRGVQTGSARSKEKRKPRTERGVAPSHPETRVPEANVDPELGWAVLGAGEGQACWRDTGGAKVWDGKS